MAGYLKSSDLGPHSYGAPHPHHSHSHGPLASGMPMSSLPFGLPPGLDAVGFPQGMWGKYFYFFSYIVTASSLIQSAVWERMICLEFELYKVSFK